MLSRGRFWHVLTSKHLRLTNGQKLTSGQIGFKWSSRSKNRAGACREKNSEQLLSQTHFDIPKRSPKAVRSKFALHINKCCLEMLHLPASSRPDGEIHFFDFEHFKKNLPAERPK